MHSYVKKASILLSGLVLAAVLHAAVRDNVFYVYNAQNGLADNSAQTVNCTKTGRLVITTLGQINFYDGQKFSYIDPATENVYPLAKYRGHAHLYFDKHHHIWLKRRQGLSCVNLTKEKYVDNITDEFEALGMNEKVEDVFVDGDNEVWLLTEKGVFYTKTGRTYPVDGRLNLQELRVVEGRHLLLFYENGRVDIMDMDSGTMEGSETAYDEQTARRYGETSVVYEMGDTLFQIRNGREAAILLRFIVRERRWDTILETPYYMSGVAERDSVLYIPTAYGYWVYYLATGEKEHVERLKMANGQMLLTDINAMAFDRQGGLWIGTEKRGLLYARPFVSPFRAYDWEDHRALELYELLDRQPAPKFTYRDKSVNCVFHDSRGWDWVGTSMGLQIYKDKNVRLPEVVTRSDGLLNNVIHCIVEDRAHHIWVGTSYGICCLVIENDRVRYINRYNEWDGVPCESFVNGRAMVTADGTVVMQALDHVVSFNPEKMSTLDDDVEFQIYPKLIRLLVNGNDVRTGQEIDGNVILERALTRTKELNLDYNQNSISLTFSGLNFFRPQQTFYRVRVKGPGMEGQWKVLTPYNSQGMVDRSGLLHLPLMSLAPGKYLIEVQASMKPDEWNTTPYEWIVNVNEPWWRTTGLFAMFGIVLLGLFLCFVYLYLKNANLRARRNNEEQGVVRRIKAFADRCDPENGLVLEPTPEEVTNAGFTTQTEFSPEFVEAMTKIMPAVAGKKAYRLTMRELSNRAGLSLQEFYTLITSNIYRNPRPMALQLMLAKARSMLLADRQRDVMEIAHECGFVSPNYFIAAFYHKYKQTPAEFRGTLNS